MDPCPANFQSGLMGWQIEASVIGRNCRIGRGAHVRGAYLLDGAVVGARAHVLGALLANGVHVGDNAVVPPGAMLSFNVRLSVHTFDEAVWSCGPPPYHYACASGLCFTHSGSLCEVDARHCAVLGRAPIQ